MGARPQRCPKGGPPASVRPGPGRKGGSLPGVILMPNVRRLALAAGLVLAAAPLATAGAQDTPAGTRPFRFTAEGYLANYWLDRGGSLDRASVGGYGIRVMFNRSDASRVAR